MFANQVEFEQKINTLIGLGCDTLRIHVNHYTYPNKYFAYAYFNKYEVVSSTVAIFHVKIKNNVK